VVVGGLTLSLASSVSVLPGLWEWQPQSTSPIGAPEALREPTRLPPVVFGAASPSPTPTPTPSPRKSTPGSQHTTPAPSATHTPTPTPSPSRPPVVAAPAWKQEMPDSTEVTVLPDGGVIGVSFVDPLTGLSALAGRTSAGGPRWSWPVGDPFQPTRDRILVDQDGNSYVPMRDAVSSVLVSLTAAGAERWRTDPLPAPCCAVLALGWDGDLYAAGVDGVVGFDALTGAPTVTLPGGDITALVTYPGGVAVLAGSTLHYYTDEGVDVPYPVDPAVSTGATLVAGIDGDVYLAGFANAAAVGAAVQKFTPAGPAWLWQGPPEAHGSAALTVTQDGGVVLTTSGRIVHALDPAGTLRWSRTLTPPRSGVLGGAPRAIADVLGNVALVYPYEYVPTGAATAYGVAVEFAHQATGAAVLTPVDFADQNCTDIRGWLAPSADTTTDHLLLGLLDRCSGRGAVMSFAVPGLGDNVASHFPARPHRPNPPMPAEDLPPRQH
jgi:hypothetical protein